MIALLISSIFLVIRTSGKSMNEMGSYQETTFTTLNNENETINYQGKVCDGLKQQEIHKSFDWFFLCFELDD